MAYKTFVNGFPLNASELNQFLMAQSVAVFLDSTARTAAIETPLEGQVSYLTGTNVFQYYNGSAWVDMITSGTVYDKTANYSTVATDAGHTIRSTGSAITVTIDNNLTVGQRIDFAQFGTGQITFAAGTGVTLNSKGSKLKTAAQYSGASVQCVASGVYWLVGDLG